jgi:hypothetical protein
MNPTKETIEMACEDQTNEQPLFCLFKVRCLVPGQFLEHGFLHGFLSLNFFLLEQLRDKGVSFLPSSIDKVQNRSCLQIGKSQHIWLHS